MSAFQKDNRCLEILDLLINSKFPEAVSAIDEAKDIIPLALFLECIGNLHFYKREFQEAINKFEEVISLDPEHRIARYDYLVGIQEEKEGHYVSAFKRFQEAIETEPQFVDPYVELGHLLVKVRDYIGALTCFSDALKLDPNEIGNYWNRVQILDILSKQDDRYLSDYGTALNEYQLAAETVPLPNGKYFHLLNINE